VRKHITTIDKASRDKSKSDNKHKRQEVQVQDQARGNQRVHCQESKHKNQVRKHITTIDKASRDKSKSDNKHKRQEVQVQAQVRGNQRVRCQEEQAGKKSQAQRSEESHRQSEKQVDKHKRQEVQVYAQGRGNQQSAKHKSFTSNTDQRASTSADNEATYKHRQTSNCKSRRLQTRTSASDTLSDVREPVLSTRRDVLEIDETWSTRPCGRQEDLKV
jgi:hypothetical protein